MRVEIVTVRVGVRAKKGEFQYCNFAIKTIRAPDENACTAG